MSNHNRPQSGSVTGNLIFCIFFRPDGEKKAYVRLAPDYDALDVANKVRPVKV